MDADEQSWLSALGATNGAAVDNGALCPEGGVVGSDDALGTNDGPLGESRG
jgi:hypothetical protein